MSVLTYLQQKASSAVLTSAENYSIGKSIDTMAARLDSWFQGDILDHIRFGSSTRGTILPRYLDEYSDIDYMVVFNDEGVRPQTYLNRLRTFVDKYYSRSEIFQSSPTIVLNLNHIKFELVPALKRSAWTKYEIPDGPDQWQYTDPVGFNSALTNKNVAELYLIKPTIRLAKIWNAANGYLFNSFLFETWIVKQSYYNCSNQKDYLFKIIDNLTPYGEPQWKQIKINRAKSLVGSVRENERQGYNYLAEAEVKKLIPE